MNVSYEHHSKKQKCLYMHVNMHIDVIYCRRNLLLLVTGNKNFIFVHLVVVPSLCSGEVVYAQCDCTMYTAPLSH